MKRVTATITTVAAIAALASCTTEKTIYVKDTTPQTEDTVDLTKIETTAPTTTEPYYVPPANDYTTSDEDLFIAGVYSLYSPIYVSDEDLLATGWSFCATLRSGVSGEAAVGIMAEAANYDQETMAFLAAIGASAVTTLCPDQAYKISSMS